MRKVSRFILPALLICILIILTGFLVLVFGRMDSKVEAQGVVGPAREASLSPEISGIIKEVLVREGEYVYAGDSVFILAAEDLEYQLERAVVSLAEANVFLTEDIARRWVKETLEKVDEEKRKGAKATLSRHVNRAAAERYAAQWLRGN